MVSKPHWSWVKAIKSFGLGLLAFAAGVFVQLALYYALSNYAYGTPVTVFVPLVLFALAATLGLILLGRRTRAHDTILVGTESGSGLVVGLLLFDTSRQLIAVFLPALLLILVTVVPEIPSLRAAFQAPGAPDVRWKPGRKILRGYVRNLLEDGGTFRLELLDDRGNLVGLVPVIMRVLGKGAVSENDEIIVVGRFKPGKPFHAKRVENLTTGEIVSRWRRRR